MIYSFRNELNPTENTLPEALREHIHFIYDMQKLDILFHILAQKGFTCMQREKTTEKCMHCDPQGALRRGHDRAKL